MIIATLFFFNLSIFISVFGRSKPIIVSKIRVATGDLSSSDSKMRGSDHFDTTSMSSDAHGTCNLVMYAKNIRSVHNINNKIIPRLEHRICSPVKWRKIFTIFRYISVNDVQRNPNLCADNLNRVYRTVLTTEK